MASDKYVRAWNNVCNPITIENVHSTISRIGRKYGFSETMQKQFVLDKCQGRIIWKERIKKD